MPSLIYKIICIPMLLAILAMLSSCNEKSNTILITKPPISFDSIVKQSSSLDTKFIGDEVKTYDKVIDFYCGIQMLYNHSYFIFLDGKDSLSFINMSNQSVKKIYIGNVLKNMGEYCRSRIEGNQLFLLNREKKYFYQYIIDETFNIVLQKKYDLNKSGKLSKLFFSVHPDATEFICKDSCLFVNYGKKGNKNYIDKEAIIFFNLNEPNLIPQFIINYPPKYDRELIKNKELLFEMLGDTLLVYGFMQDDAIGIYNSKENKIIQSNINHNCRFLTFDEKKYGNLGYTAKYFQTNENNYKLFSDSAQQVYLFKRLAQAQKTDTAVIECYVFDTQLNPIHYFKLGHEVAYCYIYKYQKGFLAFTKDLTKAYYYAF